MSDAVIITGQVVLILFGVVVSAGLLGILLAIALEIYKYWRDVTGKINEREHSIIMSHIRQIELDVHGLDRKLYGLNKAVDKLESDKRGDIWNK